MILGTTEIRKRLEDGEIFRRETWDDGCIKEASYALRVAQDGMLLDGKAYHPDSGDCPEWPITIKPGLIATLSTVERLCMPGDVAGKLGIRLEFASKGLTGLMGIQVDPFYGADKDNERLFIRVLNSGKDDIEVAAGAAVFNIEFSETDGAAEPAKPKKSTWERVLAGIVNQEHHHYSHQTDLNERANALEKQMSTRADDLEKQLSKDVEGIRNNQQSVVMFGVFLVAITILGVMLALLFNVEGAPNWVEEWGWIVLFVLFSIAALAVTGFVIVAGVVFLRSPKGGEPKKPGQG